MRFKYKTRKNKPKLVIKTPNNKHKYFFKSISLNILFLKIKNYLYNLLGDNK